MVFDDNMRNSIVYATVGIALGIVAILNGVQNKWLTLSVIGFFVIACAPTHAITFYWSRRLRENGMVVDDIKRSRVAETTVTIVSGTGLMLAGQIDWEDRFGLAGRVMGGVFLSGMGICLIVMGPIAAMVAYRMRLRRARHFARTKPCPTCSHRCAKNATACPKCEHNFSAEIAERDSGTNADEAAAARDISPSAPEGD